MNPPPLLPSLTFARFIDPAKQTFVTEVPQGWTTRGGFAHPQPGDRRPWLQTMSRDGIYVACGDSDFPQNFCHFRDQFEGHPVQMAAGGMFLNLKPAADRAADQYLKTLGKQRFGQFRLLQRRPRPDVCDVIRAATQRMGIQLSRKFQLSAVEQFIEMSFNGQTRLASILATCGFSGDYAMGMYGFWEGNVLAWIAPPPLANTAELARMRVLSAFQISPRMMEIYRQDEAIIASNGAAANAAQWNWFAGQQAAHKAQNAIGDSIVQNYWSQQAANEQAAKSREQNQAAYDRTSQNFSDATMGRQRLADDAMGKSYDVPAGHDYYWLDQQTGQVIGTDASNPPDYQRNYTQLRKL